MLKKTQNDRYFKSIDLQTYKNAIDYLNVYIFWNKEWIKPDQCTFQIKVGDTIQVNGVSPDAPWDEQFMNTAGFNQIKRLKAYLTASTFPALVLLGASARLGCIAKWIATSWQVSMELMVFHYWFCLNICFFPIQLRNNSTFLNMKCKL